MLGNVFSPYYARARRERPASPLEFVTMNAVLYTPRGKHWALTERRGARRDESSVAIGNSGFTWDGSELVARIDEHCAPFPRALRGAVRVRPQASGGQPVALDERGAHMWCPIAPSARVEVTLTDPALRFSGHGYLDCNWGREPLESGFDHWSWSRVAKQERTIVSYAATRRDGSQRSWDLEFGPRGTRPLEGFTKRQLQPTGWGLQLETRAPSSARVEVRRTLEDTPFYARSLVAVTAHGETFTGTQESLSLSRFASRWVQFLLPFKMRRAGA